MENMWKEYLVRIKFLQPFASGIPKSPEEILAMLKSRVKKPAQVEEFAEKVAGEIVADEAERGWVTFKRDKRGIYYEARCVRAHLKDCAQQLSGLLKVRGLKSLVATHLYVWPEELILYRNGARIKDIDSTEIRMVHVLTSQGPRSDIKRIDYIAPPCRMSFLLRVLNDGKLGLDIIKSLLEYGGIHGMGQERSQQWGQYRLIDIKE